MKTWMDLMASHSTANSKHPPNTHQISGIGTLPISSVNALSNANTIPLIGENTFHPPRTAHTPPLIHSPSYSHTKTSHTRSMNSHTKIPSLSSGLPSISTGLKNIHAPPYVNPLMLHNPPGYPPFPHTSNFMFPHLGAPNFSLPQGNNSWGNSQGTDTHSYKSVIQP